MVRAKEAKMPQHRALHSRYGPELTGVLVLLALIAIVEVLVRTAVINKRAGGMGLISGRKAFQRPMAEGAKLLQTIQDVYLDRSITIA